MIPSSPTKTSTDMSCKQIIREYGDLCKLEFVMHLCVRNYVGHTNVDVGLNTMDVCSQISDVKQVYNQNRRMYHDEFFDRFSTLSLSLLVKASGWSVQLCSCYLPALSKDLSEHIASAESSFVMPDLTILTTKPLQMDVLRNIRNHVSAAFKIINKRKKEMKALLREMQPSCQRGTNLETSAIQYSDSRTNGSSYSYQQSPSIVEQTIR